MEPDAAAADRHCRLIEADRCQSVARAARQLIHDLRNPVQAIVLASQGILAAAPAGGSRKLAGVIATESERMAGLLQRFDGLQWEPDGPAGAVRLADVVVELQQLFGARRFQRTVTLRIDVDAGLPPVRTHRDRLSQALFNLVANAGDALGDTGGTVELAARVDSSGVRVVVEDDGPGIPADRLEQVFEPLTGTRPSGLGLGLTVARLLVESDGGRLWAEPKDAGPGARLLIWLPGAAPG